jgi:hypothetical protein
MVGVFYRIVNTLWERRNLLDSSHLHWNSEKAEMTQVVEGQTITLTFMGFLNLKSKRLFRSFSTYSTAQLCDQTNPGLLPNRGTRSTTTTTTTTQIHEIPLVH